MFSRSRFALVAALALIAIPAAGSSPPHDERDERPIATAAADVPTAPAAVETFTVDAGDSLVIVAGVGLAPIAFEPATALVLLSAGHRLEARQRPPNLLARSMSDSSDAITNRSRSFRAGPDAPSRHDPIAVPATS